VSASAPTGPPFKPQAERRPGLLGALPSLTTMLEKLAGAQTQWTNGSPSVSIQGVPALTSKSCLFCQYGGQIRLLTNGMDPAPPEFSVR
ncbi:PAAR-like protein, partial [Paenibacillus durus]